MTITQIAEQRHRGPQNVEVAVDIVAIHGIHEDGIQTWTDPVSNMLWLRDLLPQKLHGFRALAYCYQPEAFTSPGVGSSQSILAEATNLVAELYADRQLDNTFDRPIIFICHGFGGLLAKRALAYSSSRESKGVEHLRSIYTCTYGIIFLGTPHNGINKEPLLLPNSHSPGPNQFMLSLLKDSEILNEINDQFAPLMKQFSIFNFWEELETQFGMHKFYIVTQESAAPAWDNVEKCGIMGTHSTMTKFNSQSDRRFRSVLEAISRYTRQAPALVKARWAKDAELMYKRREQEVQELQQFQRHLLPQSDPTSLVINQWCLIPRKPSTYFTGRQKHAEDVKTMLGSVRNLNDRSKTKVLVIYGLGGSGKTQFCLKYAEDQKHRYWGVFWVDASSEKSVEAKFSFIGAQAGRGATMASAIHWLSTCKQPWLLILDNADDPEVDISTYYPDEGNGHVLITTRNPNAVDYATVGHLRFRGMEPNEAVSLLLKTAYPGPAQSSVPTSPGKWHLAQEIAIELGYLPLAIAHAGATIRRNIYTLDRYLKYYLPQRKTMLSRSEMKSVDEVNIITTWEIPFQRIVSRESTEHKDAVDLMHTIAFMHHEAIPERIFRNFWAHLRVSQLPLKQRSSVSLHTWDEGLQARLRRAIGILCDHSIIEYEASKGSCTMHPVVHNWARMRLPITEQKQWLRCAMAVLAQSISPYLEASGRSFRALLLPHINSCLQLHRSQNSREPETLQSAAEMERFAWVYTEQGLWKTARQLQERIIRTRKKLLGKRHEDTIRAQRSLGQTLWNLFEIRTAIEVQKSILDTLRWNRPHIAEWAIWPIWRPIHVPYCLALSDITLTLWLAGRRQISQMTGERAVHGLSKRLGSEDPLTLNAMFNLARTYFHLGEEEKSRKLLVWVLRLQKRFFGMKHPDTLMTRNELGMLLCASKRHLVAAQRMVENVLHARRKMLGEEHAYTLWSINDLSKIHVQMGQPEEAIAMLEAIVPIVKRTLPEDHVGMSMTRSNLGKAYFVSGRWKEAEETIRPLLVGIQPDHPDSIHNMYGYAHILLKLGRVEEAEKWCTDTMDRIMQMKSLSLNDSRTVATADLLLSIYRQQGHEYKVAAIMKKFPGAGKIKNEDRFDPYTIRKGSVQSLNIQAGVSDKQPVSQPPPRQTEAPTLSREQTTFSKLTVRHTF